jgi:hypothetical protein
MHTTWRKNRTITRTLNNKPPYEMLFQKKPNLANLPIWGCHVKVHMAHGSKLDMRAMDGRWVGFDSNSNGHRIWLPGARRVAVERSVTFDTTEVRVPLKEPTVPARSTVRGYDVGPAPTPPVSHTARGYDVGSTPTKRTSNSQPHPTPSDHLGPQFESAAQPRRSSRVRVESAHIKSLRDGAGTTDGHSNDLPRGMQPVPEESHNGS